MDSEASAAVERRSPEAAFGLLANDLRVSMLRALGDAREPVSFSELRERVGERDSGKFNYHLGKLVGQFATREDDGYALSLVGRQVYGAILSGAYTADATVEPFEFDGACPFCGRDGLVAEYVDEQARLHCPGCGMWRNEFSFPPASLDQYDRGDLPAAFDRWMRATVLKVLQGFCANCGGPTTGRLDPERGTGECRCRRCSSAGAAGTNSGRRRRCRSSSTPRPWRSSRRRVWTCSRTRPGRSSTRTGRWPSN
ncbi:MAG: winged helix-turn-helix domain-containing protein [Halobacterium sp.]